MHSTARRTRSMFLAPDLYRRALVVALLVMCTGVSGPTLAVTCPEGDRWVLPPTIGAELRRAVGDIEPGTRLGAVKAECAEVRLELCLSASPDLCHPVSLSHPERGCEGGGVAGSFCVRWSADRNLLPRGYEDSVAKALSGLESADVWVAAGSASEPASTPQGAKARVAPGDTGRDGRGGGVWWWPYFMGLLLGAGPLALGLALGFWSREIAAIYSRRRWLLPLVVLVSGPLALLVSAVLSGLSTWDIVWVFSWVVGGWALGLQKTFGARDLGLLLGSIALCLLVGEGAARVTLDAAPTFPPPREARLAFAPEEREEACRQLYPDRFQGGIVSELLVQKGQEVVLHVGDSMVYGTSVARGETFTALLDAGDPRTTHWNAGQPGTGTDYHAVLLEALLPRASVGHVVLYVYPGNDLVDLDKPYACCQHGPLLDETEPRPVWRCPQPGWAFPLRALLARSPPPYLLRVSAGASALAAHAARGFSRLVSGLEPALGAASGGRPSDTSWERFTSLMRRIQGTVQVAGARLTVVVLPDRGAMEAMSRGPNHERAIHLALVQACRDLELETLDAWEPVAEAIKARDSTVVYSSEGGWDEHFSSEGHALMARWLKGRLPSP